MILLKTAPVLLLALLVGAEKKIELQDIEEDNLKSEKETENEPRAQNGQTGLLPLDFLKNGLLRYFEAPPTPQQPRYVQQYAVTEQPEQSLPPVAPKPQYGPPGAQQAMVGYYSNVPMQIYLVPQYYNEPEPSASPQSTVQYTHTAPSGPSARGYPTAPEVQPQSNYVEVPTYVTPSGKGYVQNYPQQVAYVTYTPQPAAPVQATASPVLAYQMPVIHYQTAIVAPPVAPKGYYYPQYTETNSVDDTQDAVESPKQYASQTETPHTKATPSDYPRYYNSRHPIRDDPRHSPISELPPPNPILLKNPHPHLAHLPKALPMFRPSTKAVYATGGGFIANAYLPRPSEAHGIPFRRKPTSLLDSYIPSSLQIEYMKRGYTKDPLQAYESLSSGRHFPAPRHYEKGFMPNQMYHTAAGGITFGHFKRAPRTEKNPKK